MDFRQITARTRGQRGRQHGSIMVLTLMAIGIIAGAYLYVAVIGSRSAAVTRARTSADATAMAGAIVKARVLNYEAFILMADTILLPLGQVSQNIVNAQETFYVTVCVPCELACEFCPICAQCIQYGAQQMPTTAAAQPGVDKTVTDWLDGLEAMAGALDTVGPYWAEETAMKVGMDSAYTGPGSHGVTLAMEFPLPDSSCGRLGVDMISNTKKVSDGQSDRDACHDRAYLELAYLMELKNPVFGGFNITGETEIGKMLTLGANCDKKNKVPSLASNWKDYRFSRGFALELSPDDHWQLAYLESLRQTNPPKMLETGWLLGMACAEHYAQDHYQNHESLWHMDWRARLVPCEYDQQSAVDQVTGCGFGGPLAGPATPIRLQFQNQLRLGIAKEWKW